ncbi:hypothetical protein [Marmoricola sp. RAF53]|uniref:hypothetical protein n=1 Tax=Marmoricola sp. RAF53 TaxID=3233059 RepID=UPI003F9A5B4B
MSSPGGTDTGKHAHREVAVHHGRTGIRLAVALVVLGVLLGVLVWSPWSSDPGSEAATAAPTGPPLPTYGTDWRTAAGHSYRITVTPADRTSDAPSAGGCFPAPGAGRVNARFDVRVENLSHHSSPVPDVGFAANLGPNGSVRAAVLDYDDASRTVELAPRADGAGCSTANTLGAEGNKNLPADTARTWHGVVAGVAAGIGGNPAGLRLLVRYRQVDVEAVGGNAAAEFVVPFDLTS